MTRTTFVLRYAASSIVLVAMGALSAGLPTLAAAREIPQQVLHVPGLAQPADILIDHWGVPHIYAKTESDAFFVQGFNAARDRLFQIDLWRRRGLGTLSEVFGPSYVEQDRASRLFLYRGDMQTEWQRYSPDAQQIATRFVAGINAYIDWLKQHPEQMPYEFRKLDYQPAKWAPEDVVRIRSHGLTRNLTSEVARANVACKAGLAADELRVGLQPPWQTQVPDGLDPCLPKDVLKVFDLATRNAVLTPAALSHASDGTAAHASTLALISNDTAAGEDRIEDPDETSEGSNNWVVAPGKSATGRAIMANDPHRAYSAPSLRYIAQISTPTLNIIGAGEPSLPAVSIGHNGTIAFGLTIFNIDQEDLYVYQLNPDNPGEYRYGDGWEPFRVIHETIDVRGGAPVPVDLTFTRHGPVIDVDADHHRAFAVRSAWLEPGMSPYFGSVGYMRARTFAQFQHSMLNWGAPTENQVYADVHGNIGWVPGGLAPKRPNWDGLMPVPGDGRYEWAGFWRGDQLPSLYNPKQGYFTSSNQMNLPDDYPYRERKLGFEWTNGSRHERIDEVLKALPKVSLEDSERLQNDLVSIPAQRLVALLAPLSSDDPDTHAALALLKGWGGEVRADSAQAALEEVWFSRHLGKAFKAALLSQTAAATFGAPDPAVMLDTLEHPDQRFGTGAAAKRDAVLLKSLGEAWTEMRSLEGADATQWQWGKLQTNLNAHPFAAIVDDAMRAKLNVGPLARGGDPFTPNQSTYRVNDFVQTNGPSFRVVVDVGNWDNSRAINLPGQSGDPDSPHYRDLAPLWLKGAYFPLLYSRKAVEAATETKLHLVPASQ